MIRICVRTIERLALALSVAGCGGTGLAPGSAQGPVQMLSSGEVQLRAKARLVYVSDVLQDVVYALL